jgi:hypothetical protein
VTETANDEVVVEVARELVVKTAPEELPRFRATSAAYLEDPQKVLQAEKEKNDEMLGFGVEAALLFLTPAALEIAKAVVSFLANEIAAAFEKEASDEIDRRVHRLFHRGESAGKADANEADPSERLSHEQLAHVHDLALEKARALDLPEAQAGLLADAMVGSLATS